jgi:septum formation protein
MTKRLFLVSHSPRRADILRRFGYEFEIVHPNDEPTMSEIRSPGDTVTSARRKLESVRLAEGVGLSADTVVWRDGTAYGKPQNLNEARRFLGELSGGIHQVYTGFVVCDLASGAVEHRLVRTDVHFAPLGDDEIDFIVLNEGPLDKAGAYAIQGHAGLFVEQIEGCYLNVVGLPMPALYPVLKGFGVNPKAKEHESDVVICGSND